MAIFATGLLQFNLDLRQSLSVPNKFLVVRESPVLKSRQFDNPPALGLRLAVPVLRIILQFRHFPRHGFSEAAARGDQAGFPEVRVWNLERKPNLRIADALGDALAGWAVMNL